jgi:hypothetical protein
MQNSKFQKLDENNTCDMRDPMEWIQVPLYPREKNISGTGMNQKSIMINRSRGRP